MTRLGDSVGWHTGTVIGRLTTLRTLGLLLVATVLVAAMVALGLWQFRAYDNHQRADALVTMRRAPIPLDHALGPDQAFPTDSVGVPVTVDGRYDESGQLYVRGLDGAKGPYAVVTPLVTASGSAVLVVRGSSASPQAPAPAGPVQVQGILEPSQPNGGAVDERRITDGISIASLVGGVKQDLYAGYIIVTASDPVDDLTHVVAPVPDPSRWAGVRNLLYAVQWWVFAGFVVFMSWRILADAEDSEAVDAETVG